MCSDSETLAKANCLDFLQPSAWLFAWFMTISLNNFVKEEAQPSPIENSTVTLSCSFYEMLALVVGCSTLPRPSPWLCLGPYGA